MSKKKTPSIYTAVRIPPKLRKDAVTRAAQQGRTLSNYIKNLIREDLGEADTQARATDEPGEGYGQKKTQK